MFLLNWVIKFLHIFVLPVAISFCFTYFYGNCIVFIWNPSKVQNSIFERIARFISHLYETTDEKWKNVYIEKELIKAIAKTFSNNETLFAPNNYIYLEISDGNKQQIN